jgi:hypothetical protein
MESNDDARSTQALRDAFAASSGNVRRPLTEMVKTEAFRRVRATGDVRDEIRAAGQLVMADRARGCSQRDVSSTSAASLAPSRRSRSRGLMASTS